MIRARGVGFVLLGDDPAPIELTQAQLEDLERNPGVRDRPRDRRQDRRDFARDELGRFAPKQE